MVESIGAVPDTAGPGETVSYLFNVTNSGNAPDELELSPMLTVSAFGEDDSVWTAASVATDVVPVNQTAQLNLSFTVPNQAWATSSVDIDLLHVANGYTIGTTTLELAVKSVSGWRLNLTNADLEVAVSYTHLTLPTMQVV
mgnify:FL=1